MRAHFGIHTLGEGNNQRRAEPGDLRWILGRVIPEVAVAGEVNRWTPSVLVLSQTTSPLVSLPDHQSPHTCLEAFLVSRKEGHVNSPRWEGRWHMYDVANAGKGEMGITSLWEELTGPALTMVWKIRKVCG